MACCIFELILRPTGHHIARSVSASVMVTTSYAMLIFVNYCSMTQPAISLHSVRSAFLKFPGNTMLATETGLPLCKHVSCSRRADIISCEAQVPFLQPYTQKATAELQLVFTAEK